MGTYGAAWDRQTQERRNHQARCRTRQAYRWSASCADVGAPWHAEAGAGGRRLGWLTCFLHPQMIDTLGCHCTGLHRLRSTVPCNADACGTARHHGHVARHPPQTCQPTTGVPLLWTLFWTLLYILRGLAQGYAASVLGRTERST